jgi:hypothetical protein
MKRLLLATALFFACDDVGTTPGPTDTSGDETCCFYECNGDVAEGWVGFTESATECQDYGIVQCGDDGVFSWDYVEGCLSCDDC